MKNSLMVELVRRVENNEDVDHLTALMEDLVEVTGAISRRLVFLASGVRVQESEEQKWLNYACLPARDMK